MRSFGFPAQAPPEGHLGFGDIGDLLPSADGQGAHLQLTGANDLTTGFSGGPVLDEVTGLVIGMLTEITAPDVYKRGLGIAYATPTRVLREILPELAERDVCPYRGLEPFTAEHSQWFEGRSDAVGQVVANLAQQRRLTLLLGPWRIGQVVADPGGRAARTGERRAAGQRPVNRLTFSPDGRTLVTAGVDGTARQWNVAESPEPDKAIEQVCRTFGRDLTPEERKTYLRDDSDTSVCP
ncbi:hypothetical protein ACIBAG_21145 [Streptomyces sp. NPDC051243]|uniref:nSTAND1 domain-containing NTPase n=1 Tax=Streptomyces sp. NPDC051243 TaxID=3365646 RepID=UPI0037A814D8